MDDVYLYVRKDYRSHPERGYVYDIAADKIYGCHRWEMDGRHHERHSPALYFSPHIKMKRGDFLRFSDMNGQPLDQPLDYSLRDLDSGRLTANQRDLIRQRFREYKKNPERFMWAIPDGLLTQALSTLPTWGRRGTGLFIPAFDVKVPVVPAEPARTPELAAQRLQATREREQKGRELFIRFNGGPGIVKAPQDVAECTRPATADEQIRKDAFRRADQENPKL